MRPKHKASGRVTVRVRVRQTKVKWVRAEREREVQRATPASPKNRRSAAVSAFNVASRLYLFIYQAAFSFFLY